MWSGVIFMGKPGDDATSSLAQEVEIGVPHLGFIGPSFGIGNQTKS